MPMYRICEESAIEFYNVYIRFAMTVYCTRIMSATGLYCIYTGFTLGLSCICIQVQMHLLGINQGQMDSVGIKWDQLECIAFQLNL